MDRRRRAEADDRRMASGKLGTVFDLPRRIERLSPAGLAPEGRLALIWVCLLIAVNQLGFGAIVPAIPLYAQSFGVSTTAIGLAIGVYGLARFVVNVPAGRFADRRGRKQLLIVGTIATIAGNALCALAPSYPIFLLGRFVSGAGAASVLTGGQTIVADISTIENRGRLMALYQGVFLFAVGLGPLPGGWLATHVGLAAPFAANAILSVATLAVAALGIPETRGLRAQLGDRRPAMSFGQQIGLLRSIPGFALVGFVSFTVFFARTGALFNVVPLIAKERIGLEADRIGLALGLVSIVGLALAYPSGMLVDRWGRKAVIVPATLLTAAAMPLFAVVTTWPAFLAASLVWASATGIGGAAPAAYAADSAPREATATALGTYRAVADLGYVVGPLLLGAIADLAGAGAALLFAAFLAASAALAFALFAPETLRPGSIRESPPKTPRPAASDT